MIEELDVLLTLETYFDARIHGELSRAIEFHSSEWQDSKGQDMSTFTEERLILTVGNARDDVEVNLEGATLLEIDDKAIVGPVVIDTAKGRTTYSYTLKRVSKGHWEIVYTDILDWETFPMDNETQAIKDEIDTTANIVRTHREQLLNDRWRPGYHFTVPEGVAIPFDPNGAIFWKGRYHLFYIFQDKRTGRKSDHWGHVSSTDLFHWRHHPTGLLDGMYSGNCFLNDEGTPTMCYHQVDQGNAMAVALDDELNEWRKLDSNPITPQTQQGDEHHGKYRSWDPFGWYDGERYYAIFGGQHPAIASADALDSQWQYKGDLFAHGLEGVSLDEDVSCADLFQLGGKDVLLCISHRMGCRYYIGDWKSEQFYPESHTQMSWIDNSFFAPESLQDDSGRRIMWAWLLDFRQYRERLEQGWSGTMSLPRVLSLNAQGELNIDVPSEIEALRYRPFNRDNINVPSDSEITIEGVASDSLELVLEFEATEAVEYGVMVCASENGDERTEIVYHSGKGELRVDTRFSGAEGSPQAIESATLRLEKNECLKLRVFVDRSVVEVFANRRQAIARRIYPTKPDSIGIRVFAREGSATVKQLHSWHISPSNPY